MQLQSANNIPRADTNHNIATIVRTLTVQLKCHTMIKIEPTNTGSQLFMLLAVTLAYTVAGVPVRPRQLPVTKEMSLFLLGSAPEPPIL